MIGFNSNPARKSHLKPASATIVRGSAIFLTRCVNDTNSAPYTTLTLAQQACLRDVSRVANNGDVVLRGSEVSQSRTLATLGVGHDRALWSCIAYDDGKTADIMPFTNEEILSRSGIWQPYSR